MPGLCGVTELVSGRASYTVHAIVINNAIYLSMDQIMCISGGDCA